MKERPAEIERLAYSIPSASAATDIPESTLWAYITSGQLETFKVGRRRVITRAALEAFLRSGPRLEYRKEGAAR